MIDNGGPDRAGRPRLEVSRSGRLAHRDSPFSRKFKHLARGIPGCAVPNDIAM